MILNKLIDQCRDIVNKEAIIHSQETKDMLISALVAKEATRLGLHKSPQFTELLNKLRS